MKDERYKEIMNRLGMPDSVPLLAAIKQAANEVAQEERLTTNKENVAPPIGIEPELLWREKRIHSLNAAIGRYIETDNRILMEWIKERNVHLEIIFNITKENP